MRTVYSDLDICTELSPFIFHVLKIMYEEITETIPSHSHGAGCYELHFITGGEGQIRILDRTYDIQPGYFYVTGPHISHEQRPAAHHSLNEYCFYIHMEQKHTHDTKSFLELFRTTTAWFGKDFRHCLPIIHSIRTELVQKQSGYSYQVRSLLQQLIIACVRNYEMERQVPSFPARLLHSKNKSIIVEDSFLYEYNTLSLVELAERLSLSTRQTQRYLNEVYNQTFQEKLTQARMSAAGKLLVETSLKISEISESVGYSGSEHFSYAFKHYYGMTASEYRKNH